MTIRLFVFVSGAILMALEMLGSRILAPQYGNSVIVWGSLIGVFMAALASGYWFGGRLADRWPRASGVAAVLCTSGVFVALIPLMTPFVFAVAGAGARRGSLLASVGLFFIPTMLMGAVSPYAIRLEEFVASRVGATAGSLYAISTAGSIAGTILTAFWLIPLTGVETLIELLGSALLLLSAGILIVGGARSRSRRMAAVAAAAVSVTVGIFAFVPRDSQAWPFDSSASQSSRLLLQRDSFYHRIRVSEEAGLRVLRFDHRPQTSMLLKDHLASGFPYPDYFHLAMAVRPGIKDILMIGLGGGTTPKQFLAAYPQVRMDAVEIDPEVVKVAKQWFYLPPESDRFHVIVMDGRQYLAHTNRKYDLIILDAYFSDWMPFHLATREFFDLCKSHLTQDGVMALNVVSSVTGPRSAVLGSLYTTVGEVFPERYLFAVDLDRVRSLGVKRNNCLIAGYGLPLNAEELRASIRRSVPPQYARHAVNFYPAVPDLRYAKRFSDDYAPVEDMLMIND